MTTTLRGTALLRDPQLNKSTAFTQSEREALGLVGLVPEGIDNEDTQVQRVLLQLGKKPTDLEKYIYLSRLQDTNETLFYRVLMPDRAFPTDCIYAYRR
jgi:malate dehydrogenase (oxaloacetate-decarboxylating)(NADP+)